MIKLNDFIKEIKYIEDQYLGDLKNPIGWQTICYDENRNPIGGGVSIDISIAKRISISEYCERICFLAILNSPKLSSDFEIKNHPTTCGFAAGFEREKVKMRAIAESLERWAWSKWIDEGFELEQTSLRDHTKISEFFAKSFDESFVYTRNFELMIPQKIEMQFTVFLGVKDDGVFPGSRVCTLNENSLEHAVVEAYRHLKIHEIDGDKKEFPYDRINFFAKNKNVAFSQIYSAVKKNWPGFSLKLLKEYETGVDELFVFRAIAHDFIPWNEGSIERFVY